MSHFPPLLLPSTFLAADGQQQLSRDVSADHGGPLTPLLSLLTLSLILFFFFFHIYVIFYLLTSLKHAKIHTVNGTLHIETLVNTTDSKQKNILM